MTGTVARLVGVTVALLFVSAVVVYGVFGADVWRWGCPSQSEIAERWSRDEVQSAFARSSLDLVRVVWPPELRTARPYRGAAVLRHQRLGAALHVLVCTAHCGISRFQIRPGKPRAQVRFGFDLGTNVVGWVSGPGLSLPLPLGFKVLHLKRKTNLKERRFRAAFKPFRRALESFV